MKRWRRLLLAALPILAALPASADPDAAGAASAAPQRVEIRVLGDEAALARVRATATELFARLDVRLRVLADGDASVDAAPLVLAYIDLRVPTAPRVDVDDGRTRQELMRRSLGDVSSLETGVEAAVHVVYSSVESLLQLDAAKPRVEPAPLARPAAPAAQAPPPATSERRGAGLDVGALLRLVSLAGSRWVPGAGASLDFRADAGPLQAELSLVGVIHTSSQLAFDDGRAALRPYALRLVPSLTAHVSDALLATAGVGVGLDHFVLDGQAPPSGGRALDHAVTDPVLASQLGLRFPLAGAWFASVLGTLDLDLAPTRFVAERGGAIEPLFTLPRLRAGLLVVASVSPTRVPRFATRAESP